MRAQVRFWLFLPALILFSRLFQTGVLWAEETLPLAVAQQILAGQTLYREIWFDKPPLLAYFYVGVLRLVGHSGYGLRLVGAVYVLSVAIVGYAFARRLWGETAARWTAFFLAFFTGFDTHSAAVPLAADLLLVLPHLAALYFLVVGHPWLAGLCVGLAFHLNVKALFVLAAAAGWILLSDDGPGASVSTALRRLLPLLAGFLLCAAAGLGLLWLQGGLGGYWEQVWRLGWIYAHDRFSDHLWSLGLGRTLGYLGFHAALLLGAAAFFWSRPFSSREKRQLALWMAVSFAAVVTGARFFPRYYFQILPPLVLAAGAGWALLTRRQLWWALLLLALAVPAVRFGRVNLWLALGRPFPWRDTAMDADSRRVAGRISSLAEPAEKILVWGYRPEIYYYAQRAGASRFLESQPLTGVFADRHLQRSDSCCPEWAARNRRELVIELGPHPPVVIVDGLVRFNPSLGIANYPELQPLLDRYKVVEETSGSRVYLRQGPKEEGRIITAP